MKLAAKIGLVNIAVILIYSIILKSIFSDGDAILVYMVSVSLHTLVNFVLAIIFLIIRKQETGKAFLFSTGIALLVGFSTCLGNAVL